MSLDDLVAKYVPKSDRTIFPEVVAFLVREAILDERERCARIAESLQTGRRGIAYVEAIGREIAEAIRKGESSAPVESPDAQQASGATAVYGRGDCWPER
jgi:hypothetical protein